MIIKFRLRRDSSSEWTSKNPILSSGEPGLEIDTHRLKVGDGLTRWSELSYFLDEEAIRALVNSLGGSGSDSRVGDLSVLSTNDKTDLVHAINEINTSSVSLVSLYNNAKAG